MNDLPPTLEVPSLLGTPWVQAAIGLGLLLVVALLLYLVARRYVLRGMRKLIDLSSVEWDGMLFQHRVPHRMSLIIPLLVMDLGLPWVPGLRPDTMDLLRRVVGAGMLLVAALTLVAFLSAAFSLYLRSSAAPARTITSYIQLTKVSVYLVAAVFVVARLANQTPWYLVSGLGAIMAIVLLIFRDTLLSMVASVQVANLDLVRLGDRIEMPQLGADGEVVDIALTSVQVRNLDRTITIIPTHLFLTNSFRNWRAMVEEGGRRIMRAVHVNTGSIRFLDEEELRQLGASERLHAGPRGTLPPPGARIEAGEAGGCPRIPHARATNIGALRAYLTAYLREHPSIRQDLPLFVRQLEATPEGLPLQLYAFATDTRLEPFEAIQAEIFDHVMGVIGEFGLEVYQRPAGRDFRPDRYPS